ncbi:5-hydroxytryptamine receptor 3A-like isoform X1 [Rhinichthys klamathensis goyatoka]|uniref:5-hydroxytryptamine receptor 3A-like isoform X1 n=2 Tax=Rhinichthys klamathensis goyatoka TaxID=3034132 RepID=UPI0024B58000|nr:5-hydroxytryptamine receptor 3A-like isoform X1 [Rhinichthys klamathensis goyatoka]
MSSFLVCVTCLLFLIDGVYLKQVCSKQDVLEYLNLTRGNEKFTTCRPALDWTHPTVVYVDIYLYGILSMIEKSQIFVPLLWMSVSWNNERISWDPKEFCGIKNVTLPKEMLWKPDLYVLETAEKEDGPLNPFLFITHDGNVTMEDDHKIVSTCTMNVHKFPFDTQTCHITVSSINHSDKEIKLVPASNSSKATQVARESILTQGEWVFLNISVSMEKDNYEGQTFDRIKYTISVKRMPLMHFINFQLPILFFLILDLASFFIPDRGEKLCFKVTVLLGISVLLLILNDILPSKSHRCPLIATYVIVIFSFMLLSLLETILVIYLINMSSEQDTKWVQRQEDLNCETDKRKGDSSDHICYSVVEAPLETLMLKEIYSKDKMNDMHLLQMILEELQTIKQTLPPHTLKAQTGQKYWLGMVICINRLFFVVYLISISLFLGFIFREWKVE